MRYLAIGASVGVLLVLFPSCGAEGGRHPHAETGVTFETVYRGTSPAVGGSGANVARLLCDRRGARQLLITWQAWSALPRLASVDLPRSCLIAVRAAAQPSTGYRIRVAAIRVRRGRAIVAAVVSGQAGAAGMAISRPYTLLSLDRSVAATIAGPIVVRVR